MISLLSDIYSLFTVKHAWQSYSCFRLSGMCVYIQLCPLTSFYSTIKNDKVKLNCMH